ncbi:Gustatory receptor 127a [Halyomorpha halys]|nr:Gustatory receptor 127a [Halyomorpha halys]
MKVRIRTRNCEDACTKITWGIRTFGMLPLNKRFQLDLRLLATSTLTIVFLVVNTTYWMTSGNVLIEGFYHKILYASRKILETFTVMVIVAEFLVKRDRFRSVVYNLKTVESALADVGQRWTWSLNLQHYFCFPFLTIVLIISPIFYSGVYFWPVMHIEIFFIGIYISHISTFYDMLRYILIQIRTTEECTMHTKLYSMVETSCEDLNALNGSGIFLMIFTYFLDFLHQVYQCLNVDYIPLYRYVDIICSAMYYSVFILWVIITCNGISSEASRFNTDLYKRVVHSNKKKLNFDDIIFHFDMKKGGLQFEANGFFSVNNSLICSMIIAATTYLVILLQWSPRVPAYLGTTKN